MIDKFTVVYEGKPVIRLNEGLVLRQGVTDEGVELLKDKHCVRLFIEDVMRVAIDIHTFCGEEYNEEYENVMRRLFSHWQLNQFQLQSLWGFPQDKYYHNSYVLPGCRCTNKLDNMDSLGSSMRYHNVGDVCPFHHPMYQHKNQHQIRSSNA